MKTPIRTIGAALLLAAGCATYDQVATSRIDEEDVDIEFTTSISNPSNAVVIERTRPEADLRCARYGRASDPVSVRRTVSKCVIGRMDRGCMDFNRFIVLYACVDEGRLK